MNGSMTSMELKDMVNTLIFKLQDLYETFMWEYGPERKLLAAGRLAAHKQAMKDGRNSPYTHPEEYRSFY